MIVMTTELHEEKLPKPWYRKRRYQAFIIILLIVYFCFVPSCLKISPETTGLDDPILQRDGMPDYFAEYEKSWIEKLTPPEDNGQRLMIAACGPRILEQNAMVDMYSWEEISTGEYSKKWFEEYWIPLCEHMYIDPYAKPEYLDSREVYGFVDSLKRKRKEAGEEPIEKYEDNETLRKGLTEKPWTAEDYPEIAGWLKERNPVLDLFGIAVRKPNFVGWRQRPENGGICWILLPDVQANRAFARDLAVRIAYRVGQGDIDGAWYDVMSMLSLSRKHYLNDGIIVTNLVGIAAEGIGHQSLVMILKYGNPTAEQLDRFAADLAALPRRAVLDNRFEENITYDVLYQLARGDRTLLDENQYGHDIHQLTLKYLSYFPFDLNVAGKRLAEHHDKRRGNRYSESAVKLNPMTARPYYAEKETRIVRLRERGMVSTALSIPLIRTRSRLIADEIIISFDPAFSAAAGALARANAKLALAEIAVALERYQKAEGKYPETLQTLVPKYLDEIPIDPCMNRKTITYRLTPDAESPYLLYSYGPNGKDDGGVIGLSESEGDLVFQR